MGYGLAILKLLCVYTKAEQIGKNIVDNESQVFYCSRKVTNKERWKVRMKHPHTDGWIRKYRCVCVCSFLDVCVCVC